MRFRVIDNDKYQRTLVFGSDSFQFLKSGDFMFYVLIDVILIILVFLFGGPIIANVCFYLRKYYLAVITEKCVLKFAYKILL